MAAKPASSNDEKFMRMALALARKSLGQTSPNPLVGAVLVKNGSIIGKGWHHVAGRPHAEIEALLDAAKKGNDPKGATLYVTLEPCCTHGRTPPCTSAILLAGIKRVVVAATDPNPKHSGKGFFILKKHGVEVVHGILAEESARMNEVFNHWIVCKMPFVTVKAAMTLDGKIATATGESKWITGPKAREHGMKLRCLQDGVLVGINTVLLDDPSLTLRTKKSTTCRRRIILDSLARTPLNSKVVSDEFAQFTTIVVSPKAPKSRIAALSAKVKVLVAPVQKTGKQDSPPRLNLKGLMRKLGSEQVTSLLVEGGGEVNASFIESGLAQRVAFFYAPKILGGRNAKKGVAGNGIKSMKKMVRMQDVEWKTFGEDLFLTGRIESPE